MNRRSCPERRGYRRHDLRLQIVMRYYLMKLFYSLIKNEKWLNIFKLWQYYSSSRIILTEIFGATAHHLAEAVGSSVSEIVKPYRTFVDLSLEFSGLQNVVNEETITDQLYDLINGWFIDGFRTQVMLLYQFRYFSVILLRYCVIKVEKMRRDSFPIVIQFL